MTTKTKKLSPAQTRFMAATQETGRHSVPWFCGGTTASAWYRTAESLQRKGLVVVHRGNAFLPKTWAEHKVAHAAQDLKEARTTLKRCSHWRSVANAEAELAKAEAAHEAAVAHLNTL